jgi:hypothetical protein
MQDLTEAYLSIYEDHDDLNEVKGFGGRVDPKTGKYTGEVSTPGQKVFQQYTKDVQHLGRKAGSSARSRSITHGEPNESGVVRSRARGVDVTKQDPGLAMTPAKRMETRATALRARGQGKRANKIDAVRNRPNMQEDYMDEKRLFPGAPDYSHSFPLSDAEKESARNIGFAAKAKAEKQAAESPTKSPAKKKKKLEFEVRENVYDLVLTHLLDEGYCDSQDSAVKMMAAMSQDWINSIVEEFVDPEHGETPSGRTPMQNIEDKSRKVRKKALKGFEKQMGKEYGGKWKYQER